MARSNFSPPPHAASIWRNYTPIVVCSPFIPLCSVRIYSGSESVVSSICTDELSTFVNIALSSINTSLSSASSSLSVGELLAAAELELAQFRLLPMVLSNA